MKPMQYIKCVENRKVIRIPINKIVLTEQIHTNEESIQREKIFLAPYNDYMAVVRKMDNGQYSLVLGWADYISARNNNKKNIPCVVTTMTREKFINSVNKKMKKLSDISDEITKNLTGQTKMVHKIGIRKGYKLKKISAFKVREEVQYLLENKTFSEPIILEKGSRELCGGYTQYAAAKLLGIKVVPIKYVDKCESE